MSAVIRGLAGDDNLSGTTGDDVFNLSLGGNDTVDGGDGNDIFWMGSTLTAADKIDGGTGSDRVNLNGDYTGANALTFAADTMVNVEHLYLASGHSYDLTTDDATVAAGGKLSVNATSLGAGDSLTFDGSAETDGRFNIFAGHGDDTITGGALSDVFHLDTGGTDTLHAGGGDDWIYVGSTLGTFGHVDNIDGGTGFDTLFMDGMGDDAVIFGVNAIMTNVDYLVLGAGHSYTLVTEDATVAATETLYVDGSALGAGSPLIFDGSAETDGGFAIFAGAGNDTITGGQVGDYVDLSLGGNDTVTLGAGINAVYMGAALTAADNIVGNGVFDVVELAGAYEGIHAVTFSATTMTGVELLELDRGFSYDLTSNDATVSSGANMIIDGTFLSYIDSVKFDGSAETDGSFTFNDSAGYDTFKGGAGADTFSFELGGHDTGMGNGGDDYFDACGQFDSGDKFDGGSGYDIVELDASATPNFRYAFDHALNITADMLSNFEEMDLDGGGIYDITTDDGVVAAGVTFKVDATFSFGGDLLNFDGSAETDGSFEFDLGAGSYHLIGGAQNDTFKVGADFAVNDRIDGGGSTSPDGNTVVFEGDYSGGFIFKAASIQNIHSLQFIGDYGYAFVSNDGNFASGTLATIDGSTVGALGSLRFDASHEHDADLSFFDGAGDDVLIGGQGQNNYFNMTGGGNDTIHTLFSLSGSNHIYMFGNLTAADTIDAKGGFDEVQLDGDYTGTHALVFGATTMTGVDTLTLEGGHSYDLTTDDATVDSFLNPSLTVDSTALLSTDTLKFDGSAESDCNFIFNAGAETDTIVGGAFGDTFNMGANLTASDSIDGGGGIDTVNLDGDYSGANALVLGATTLQNITYLNLAGGNAYNITTADGTVASGSTMTIDASTQVPGDSLIFDGSAESDGHFIIIAGDGEDTFISGQLADTITGGGGEDTFRYASGAMSSSIWHDTITDYTAGTDVFYLGNSVTGVFAASGAVSAASFDGDVAALAAMHVAGATVITVTGGDLNGHTLLMIDGDGNATYDAGTDYIFDITNYTGTITTGDFI
ncbi:MAG: calcium-binding protein [Alphaproteobacteria bacterium]|nr:calcium-binding protein [Alphaproteobacteria bacterium]